jgi:hypothetical protein
LRSAAQQALQQRELARGQLDRGRTAPAAVLGGVEHQVPGPQRRRPIAALAAQQRPQPHDQHLEREGLAEEVVGADLQRLGLGRLALLGGQHQHRRPVAVQAQLPAEVQPVDRGQQQVEHDHVEAPPLGHRQARAPVEGDLGVKALGGQAIGHGGGERLVVLDYQDPEGTVSHGLRLFFERSERYERA